MITLSSPTLRCCVVVAAVLGALAFSAPAAARGAIVGINTPGTSTASIVFDDTFSVAPPAGVTNGGPSSTPWNGSLLSMLTTTDPVTLDFASGDIDATFAGNTYAINLNNVTLNQMPTNTGTAHLIFTFNVEYQLDATGLPSQPTLYPNFIVNGTVQPSVGSFAAVSGFIDYSGVNTAGTYSVLETVNYNSFWNTPGPFTAVAPGTPVNGTTPIMMGNTTFTMNGVISFQVDPASINAHSQMVPEPSSLALAAMALGFAGARRRRRCR
jgi:hypothetical protein